jgi:uncharacterized protein involved in cysteine biosynthesis
MIITAFFRALPQIALPPVRGVLWRTLGLTLLLFVLLGAGLWAGLRALFLQLGWPGHEGLAGAALAVMIAVLCAWLLFRAVAIGIVGLYADRIVAAVEQASYGERHALARVVPVTEGLAVATRSILRAIGWNLVALPLYALLLFTGIGAPLLFLLVNAYLLGRDMAELVEGRHPDLPRLTAGERWQIGLVSALLFLPPVVNLFAPVWSVAIAAHMFHANNALRA